MPGAKISVLFLVIFGVLVAVFAAGQETVLYSFCSASGCRDGSYPYFNGVIFDTAGNLYGATAYGGTHKCSGGGCGTVFQLVPQPDGSWTHKVLHNFNGTNGAYPNQVVLDAAGNLYGTTRKGGAHNIGIVYELVPGAKGNWTEKVLYNFSGKDGNQPNAGLVFDSSGNLYGTTSEGGGEKGGVVFQLVPGANGQWTEKVLKSNSRSVSGPGTFGTGGLSFDVAGNLYGASIGGRSASGQIFRLKPMAKGKWKHELLFDFDSSYNSSAGMRPPGGLIFDATGNLYGVTWYGGTLGGCGGIGCGVVFELTPSESGPWTETVLHDFDFTDGEQPNPLLFDTAGNLYGTTAVGGGAFDPGGTVFKLTRNTNGSWTETILYNFCSLTSCADGDGPFVGVVFDTAGDLYGTTDQGGANINGGTVFEVQP